MTRCVLMREVPLPVGYRGYNETLCAGRALASSKACGRTHGWTETLHLGALSVRAWGALSLMGLLFQTLLQSWVCKPDSWPPGEGPREGEWAEDWWVRLTSGGHFLSAAPFFSPLSCTHQVLPSRGINVYNGSIFKTICCA